MSLSRLMLISCLFLAAALASLLASWIAVGMIEDSSKEGIERQLMLQNQEWSDVRVDGLQVILSGTAPDENTRFRALSIAASVVDATRVTDQMTVREAQSITPPRFAVEILRNDAGISLIGLIPAVTDREKLTETIVEIAGETDVTDLLEVADYPMPDNWPQAMGFALEAMAQLPRSKISVSSERVAVTAIADSAQQKGTWETKLTRSKPEGLSLALDISAPRPVITPFTLRFIMDADGTRFDACSSHSPEGRAQILSAAADAGLAGKVECTIGLGVPSPDWPQAVVRGVDAVTELGGGSITFSDADVTLVAPDTTPQALFDKVVGELEADLPEVFSLHSVLPEPVKIDGSGDGDGPPEFIATLSPEGLVQLRGRLSDERQRLAAESYARSRFGVGAVYAATRLDDELPDGWSNRVLAGLEALSLLTNGVVVVQPDIIDIKGKTGQPNANAEISRILSDKLGGAENYQVSVEYIEALDPDKALPSPEECVSGINAILGETKIRFDPGSANINSEARGVVDKIAALLKECPEVPMEIAGYTDSQGREGMNQALSQNRAQAVLNALLARRILTSNLDARGYGENDPVADNGTEEGREANRRIEFRLILPEGEAVVEDAGETPGDPAQEAEAGAEVGTADPAAPEDGTGDAQPSEQDTAEQADEQN